jgi:hypothetical protein
MSHSSPRTSTRQDSASSRHVPTQADRQRVFEGIPTGSNEVAGLKTCTPTAWAVAEGHGVVPWVMNSTHAACISSASSCGG